MSYALALRKPGVRRALSRVAANFTAVVAVSAIFGLKAYIDTQGKAHAAAPDPYEARVLALSRAP